MLIVLDNVLTESEMIAVRSIVNTDPAISTMRWIDGDYATAKANPSPIATLISIANRYFDVTGMCGAEFWAHNGTRPDWHVDKDEKMSEASGTLSYPICSIVYYAEVDGLKDGQFMTDTINVTPINNRMIVFAPGIMHGVQPYEGKRVSLAVNPWATKPMGY
jgi:hypothetical protein